MDEPTAGLIPNNVFYEKVIVILPPINCPLATHVVADVEWIADEILLLKDGSLIVRAAEGPW